MYPTDSTLNYYDDGTVAFFSTPFEPLNNWSAHRIELWGQSFATAEHAFQFAKFRDTVPSIAEQIVVALSPWQVFQITTANRSSSPEDWNERKTTIMTEIIGAKTMQNEDVKERLLATGNRRIIENSPYDSFWGVGADGNGQNMLGKIYMELREQLQSDTN